MPLAGSRCFDDFLGAHAGSGQQPFIPFDIEDDYTRYVDGKPRYEGVRSFLQSRSIALPYGSPADDPVTESVCGLGNRKDELVKQAIAAVDLLHRISRRAGGCSSCMSTPRGEHTRPS